jgi:hypothetical protein
MEILPRLESKALCMTGAAPCYVMNTVIPMDHQTPTVKKEIRPYSSQQVLEKRIPE